MGALVLGQDMLKYNKKQIMPAKELFGNSEEDVLSAAMLIQWKSQEKQKIMHFSEMYLTIFQG